MRKCIRRIVTAVVLLLVICAVGAIFMRNAPLELTEYTVTSRRLPASFDGFRIAQISDLHNTQFGENNEQLLAMLQAAKPDMIAITGDMIDGRRTDVQAALQFAQEAVKIAPCYYVNGNHEQSTRAYFDLKNGLEALGVEVLEDDWTQIVRDGQRLRIVGVMDPSYPSALFDGDDAQVMLIKLEMLKSAEDYTVLLCHRPEMFEVYSRCGIDLALTGHAHGGLLRLPFVGGVFAPDQGFFPKYDGGLFADGDTQMIVSRGLGNSLVPIRINNPPEVVLITLECE